MKILFYKRPKPKQFSYKPLYYDPDLEAAEERKQILEGLQSKDPKERMRAQIRRKWKTDRSSNQKGFNLLRIAFYILFAVLAVYLIFFTDFVNKLVSVFVR